MKKRLENCFNMTEYLHDFCLFLDANRAGRGSTCSFCGFFSIPTRPSCFDFDDVESGSSFECNVSPFNDDCQIFWQLPQGVKGPLAAAAAAAAATAAVAAAAAAEAAAAMCSSPFFNV